MKKANPSNTDSVVWIAGLRVSANRSLAGAQPIAGSSWDLRVQFDSDPIDDSDTCAAQALGEESGWYVVPPPSELAAWVRGDGRLVVIREPEGPQIDHSQQVRQVVPFAAALQGRLVIHGSAVKVGPKAHTFVGPSAVGKSTLAAALDGEGCLILAEDLLPCRIEAGVVTVVQAPMIANSESVRLATVHFLERRQGIAEPSLERLSRPECLRLLMRHGFGELAIPRVWALQFEHYQTIAAECQAFRLVMPDDLSRLRHAAAVLARRLATLGEIQDDRQDR